MATQYGNRIKVAVTSTGTGTAQLGSAVTGFLDFSSLTSGNTVGYAIDDGANWEIGTGVYTSGSPSTVTRANIESSTNGGAAISLSGSATMMLSLTAAQFTSPSVTAVGVNNTTPMVGGLTFGSVVAGSQTDLSHHISLWGTNQYGFSITGGTLNVVSNSAVAGTFTSTGLNATPIGASTASTGSFTTLVANDPSTSATGSFQLIATSDTNGCNLLLAGNGATTPNKTIRVFNGQFQIINSVYSAAILTLTDAGALTALSMTNTPISGSTGSFTTLSASSTVTVPGAISSSSSGFNLNAASGVTALSVADPGAGKPGLQFTYTSASNTWNIVGSSATNINFPQTGGGNVQAPTPAVNTNNTQIATTAFVVGQAGTGTPIVNGTATVGTSLLYARQDHVHPTDTSRAPTASPTFTGTATTTNLNVANGTLTVGSNTTAQGTLINGPAATNRYIQWQTAGSERWLLFTENTAESGSNTGSNFQINAYGDTGAYASTPFQIIRASGQINMPLVNIDGGTIDNTAIGATTPSSGNFTQVSANNGTSGGYRLDDTVGSPHNVLIMDSSNNVTIQQGGAQKVRITNQSGSSEWWSIDNTGYMTATAGNVFYDIGRNLLHNPQMQFQQRAGPFTGYGYTVDRWLMGGTGDTFTVQGVTATDTMRAAVGDERMETAFQVAITGTSGTSSVTDIVQRLESARLLANKTVTLSFWAATTSGTMKVGINGGQAFGTGGSPSAAVTAVLTTGLSATITTTWTRYTFTLTFPSVAGKTFGTTASTDYSAIDIYLSSGATNNAVAGNIGVQSGTIQFWGMQLEYGSAATPLDLPTKDRLAAQCFRFYYAASAYSIGGASVATDSIINNFMFPMPMRVAPSITPSVTGGSGYSTPTIPNVQVSGFSLSLTATAAAYIASFSYVANADL